MVDQGFYIAADEHSLERVALVVGDADQFRSHFFGKNPDASFYVEVAVYVGLAAKGGAKGPKLLHRFVAEEIGRVEQRGGMDFY